MTLTPERIEEIRKRHSNLAAQAKAGGYDQLVERMFELNGKESHKDRADLLSAYDALSRDGMREALVKARAWIEAETRPAMNFNAWHFLLKEIDAALSPDAPRQKVEG